MSDLKTPCVPISKIDVEEGFNARTHMDEKEQVRCDRRPGDRSRGTARGGAAAPRKPR